MRKHPTPTLPRRHPVGVALETDLLHVLDEEVLRRRRLVLDGKLNADRASRTAVMVEALEAKLRTRRSK